MKRLALLVLALGLPVFVVAEEKPDANKAALKALQGNWTIDSIEENGKKVDFPKDTIMKISDEKIAIVASNGKNLDESVLVLDATKSPKVWDVKQEGKTELGIYKVEGDKLTVCTTKKKDRPTEFKSGPDTAVLSMTRKKDK